MNPTYEKIDELTFKISWTTPYEQVVTKDQLNTRIKEIDSNIEWFNKGIAELEENKIQVQALLIKSDELWLITRDERRAKQPLIDPKWTWDLIK
jgi:hypothetical protein